LRGSYTAPKEGWTCYHCGVTFIKPRATRDHYGEVSRDKAKCQYHDLDVEKLEKENAALKEEVEKWKFEAEVLRLYGNKDCTALADERIASGEPIG